MKLPNSVGPKTNLLKIRKLLGLGNCIVYKRFAVQTHLWFLKQICYLKQISRTTTSQFETWFEIAVSQNIHQIWI